MRGNEYRVEYAENVLKKDIPALPHAVRGRIRQAIEQKLAVNPSYFGAPLRYKLAGYWRLRVGDYRVVYRILHDVKKVHVLQIDHRKDIYD